jgi:hypothetical protein
MSEEEIDLEELERELRELESEKAIEIKPVAETTAVVAQTEEKGKINVESLEKELEKAELIAEKKYLEKHGGLCHHVKLEKLNEPITVCRDKGIHEDDEKLLVSLLYKYYPYVSKAMQVIDEIEPCEKTPALKNGFDVVVFADPIRMGSLYYGGFDTMIAELAYIYELDIDKDQTLGVHLEIAIKDNKPSIKSTCRIDKTYSLMYSLLKALRLPIILDLNLEEGF